MADEADTSIPSDLAFSSPFCSDNFVFLVGKEKERFNVNVDILGKISLPLKTLMTNGAMKESLQGFAELPDIEPRTFDLMLQFAYNGLRGACAPVESQYWIPRSRDCVADCDEVITLLPASDSEDCYFPCCGSSCWTRWVKRLDIENVIRSPCLVLGCKSDVIYREDDRDELDESCFEILCRSHSYLGREKVIPSTRQELSQALQQRKHLAVCLDFWLARSGRYSRLDPIVYHLPTLNAQASSTVVNLAPLDYVKLFAAADRYMVPNLKSIATHLFYVKLCFFEINAYSMPQFLELLDRVWELPEEERLEYSNISMSMRAVIFDYVRSQKKQMLKSKPFMDFLSDGRNALGSQILIKSLATERQYLEVVYGDDEGDSD